jgi:hypothetical protein
MIKTMKKAWYKGKRDHSAHVMRELVLSYRVPHIMCMSSPRYATAFHAYTEATKQLEALK